MNNGFYVLYSALNKICELRKRIKIYSIEYFLGTKIPGIFVIYIQHKYIEWIDTLFGGYSMGDSCTNRFIRFRCTLKFFFISTVWTCIVCSLTWKGDFTTDPCTITFFSFFHKNSPTARSFETELCRVPLI